jgi:protein-S-isoprenylcysteine O-methyltransferase Ste14
MSLRSNWINLFYKIATGSKKVRTLFTPIGAFCYLVFIGLMIVVASWTDKMLGIPQIIPSSWRTSVSVPILVIGIFLGLWSFLHFLRVKGTPVPFNPPPRLVTTGPYAYIRNPMLTGLFITMLGLGLWVNSVSLIFIYTPLFILINVLELKAIEEPELAKRLGVEYTIYKQRTPMFIPRLKIKT